MAMQMGRRGSSVVVQQKCGHMRTRRYGRFDSAAHYPPRDDSPPELRAQCLFFCYARPLCRPFFHKYLDPRVYLRTQHSPTIVRAVLRVMRHVRARWHSLSVSL